MSSAKRPARLKNGYYRPSGEEITSAECRNILMPGVMVFSHERLHRVVALDDDSMFPFILRNMETQGIIQLNSEGFQRSTATKPHSEGGEHHTGLKPAEFVEFPMNEIFRQTFGRYIEARFSLKLPDAHESNVVVGLMNDVHYMIQWEGETVKTKKRREITPSECDGEDYDA